MRHNRRRMDRGFTLVELMIVVGIIGVIASLAIPNYLKFTARTRRTEMMETVSKMQLYFKNTYDNVGTMSTSSTIAPGATSSVNPATLSDVGTAAEWNPSAPGWSDFQFPPEGGVKMRYSYTLSAADASGNVSDVTINVCGAFAGLGANTVTCPGSMHGNYLYTEVFHGNGSLDPPTEFPAF